jgi:hypothetical protein
LVHTGELNSTQANVCGNNPTGSAVSFCVHHLPNEFDVDVGVDAETAVSNDYKQGDNKFRGNIISIMIDTQPSNLSAADKKAVEHAQDGAATIED